MAVFVISRDAGIGAHIACGGGAQLVGDAPVGSSVNELVAVLPGIIAQDGKEPALRERVGRALEGGGNRIIGVLQEGGPDAAQKAQALSKPKQRFQDMMDELFEDTGKKIIRTENEIRFTQIGETLVPYQLSTGEKQMLAILLTVLVENQQHYVLFMDEPEVSLHIEWQKQLIDLILELNPNVQLILTTHSPAMIMNGWIDRVTEVSDITDRF